MSDKQNQVERHIKGMKKAERSKSLKSANKKMKRSQSTKTSRRKDWIPDHIDDVEDLEAWEDIDYETTERIMPLAEKERRRTVESLAFRTSPVEESEGDEPSKSESVEGSTGLVIEVSKGLCRVDMGDYVVLCGLRGNLTAEETGYMNAVAVGDQVIITEDGAGGGIVESVLPRRSVLARPDPFYTHMQQIIVANVDQLLIVAAWLNPPLWLEMVDRYLVFAQMNDLDPIICINKSDLIDDEVDFVIKMQPYLDLGYPVIRTSAVNGEGVDDLRAALYGHTSVLSGMSGVGKSSLISQVQPGLSLRTSQVSDASGEGRHTTTQAVWLKLADGGAVVDTPGIREFGLTGLHPDELVAYFPEMDEAADRCRFRDCQHVNEPGCAVREAVEAGDIAETRYHSYKLIHAGLSD